MFYQLFILTAFVLATTSAAAQTQSLCHLSENTIFSFKEVKSSKLLSLCKGAESKYLVYRFGKAEKVELQFPGKLDESSWEEFEFFGRRRSGGKMNAGFGDYWISFKNGPAEYVVFQEWSDEDDTYSIGVNVEVNGKIIALRGSKKSQQGSLVLLESESRRLKNSAQE